MSSNSPSPNKSRNHMQASIMTGTTLINISKALNTFENEVGPGQYDQSSSALVGAKHNVSKYRNAP